MRRYNYFTDDLMDWFWWDKPIDSGVKTFRGQWVDTERFDVIPKQSYLDERLKEKEEQLTTLQKEIDNIKSQRKALKTG